MALSDESMHKIADALVNDIASDIYNSEEWTEFMIEQISDSVVRNLGELDCDLHGNLVCMILDRLDLKSVTV